MDIAKNNVDQENHKKGKPETIIKEHQGRQNMRTRSTKPLLLAARKKGLCFCVT
jgi:hypothetical protein